MNGYNGRLVYSGVSVLYDEKTKSLSILPDRYDFDYQEGRSFGRNATTTMGGGVASVNGKFPITPYEINFQGDANFNFIKK